MKLFKHPLIIAILALLLLTPGPAFATVENGDQNDLSAEEIAAAIARGEVSANDSSAASVPSTYAGSSYVFTTIGGATRYETSASQALSSFSSAQTVVVAGGETYVDSIAGSGLAGALNSPILLVPPTYLEASTKNALINLAPTNIIILGGTDVVSTDVEQQLKGYASQVFRLSGTTRFETQQAIYNYGVTQGLWTGDTAVVATGMEFADALSISPVAFTLKAPIFFTDSSDNLPASQLTSIEQAGKPNSS